ncbi:MAG TPA: hypothetical protein VJ877_01360 [Bacteroidales bacterium]|nr:hypothetical protein [Bacteroidales bacterium]
MMDNCLAQVGIIAWRRSRPAPTNGLMGMIIDAGLQMRNILRTETWQLVAAFEST